jgi:hypothetical protein
MAGHAIFEKDLRATLGTFPKLCYTCGKKLLFVDGELDICDQQGTYWGTFQIRILLSHAYPYCVPLLYEKSKIIPRNIDYHIDENGLCCVDIDHKLLVRSKHGLTIQTYLVEWVYPYLANQLHRIKETKYAGGEYAHYFAGVRQFYSEDLRLNDEAAIKMLEAILSKVNDGRNNLCPCGSGIKLKRCHWNAYTFLKSLDMTVLKSDLRSFQKP